ncbi:MAG: hypothetical protein IJK84_05585 [Bacteroidales bacterium]|nr:hypothetical protein [Bacteroidales bacterium]
MKRLFPILTALALLCTACHTQEEEVATFNFDNTCWFDGYEYFVGSPDTVSDNPDLTIFNGGTLHEGGSTFALLKVATDTFVIQPYPGEEWTAVGVEGDTAVLLEHNGKRIIVCLNPEDEEADTLWMYDPGDKSPMKAYEDLLIQKRINSLAGTYYDSVKKVTYHFADTTLVRTTDKGVADTQTFHFFYSFEMPSHLLQLSNGEQFWYEITPTGMDLFKAKYWSEEDDYMRQYRFAQLKKQ